MVSLEDREARRARRSRRYKQDTRQAFVGCLHTHDPGNAGEVGVLVSHS
jgi:hypothetical protein